MLKTRTGNNWKKYYKAFKISDRVAVCPSWLLDPDSIESDIKIILDPGSAFAQEPMRLPLCALRFLTGLFIQMSLLDLGTGSGF